MKILLLVFLVLMVSRNVLTQRPVVNTTCLELAKPSNQHLRLSCSQYDYHCLLDETYTKELEVCKEWKWIPGGRCAYFNTYGSGNVDERECTPGINLTCSESIQQFESTTNTRFTACYAKRGSDTTTSSPVQVQVTSNMTSGGDIATPYPTSKAWIIFLLFIAFLLTICGIFFIHSDIGKLLCKKESQESSSGAKNDDTAEQQPILKSETDDKSKNQPTLRHEDETITEARKNGNSGSDDSADESDFFESLEDLSSSDKSVIPMNSKASTETPHTDVNKEIRTNEVNSDKSAEVDTAGGLNKEAAAADVQSQKKDEENSTENALGLCIEKSEDAGNDRDESTDLFDDTLESLEKLAPTTDEEGRELCTELYRLLENEGQKLTQEVMTAVITREAGKSVKTLTDHNKSKLTRVMPEGSHHFLESIKELETSFHVSYGLNRILLDQRHHPKSGWGKPVRGKDIGVGDDVERLYRIMTIIRRISNPVTVSVEGYVKLLNVLIEALTRLDPDAEFKGDYKELVNKLTSIKNPSLMQRMIKTVRWIKL